MALDPQFASIAFEDAPVAERRLDGLIDGAPAGFVERLAAALCDTGAPDVVLTRLERFIEKNPDRDLEKRRIAETPRYARLACTLFDQSLFLTDLLCRRPRYLVWLWEEAILRRPRTPAELLAEVTALFPRSDDIDRCMAPLREFRHREFLRIATRDIFMHAPLVSVMEDISNLADAVIDVAWRLASATLLARYGDPMPAHREPGACPAAFCVVAMGKLGGRELNYSSDVDLLFLYSEDGQTRGGPAGAISNAEYFQKLGEHTIRLLSEQTAQGHVFRVDMRLRPHGRMSPLAVSIDNAIHYYGYYGQVWERQALIKARPVAGDAALGEEFVAQTRRFVFPTYFDDEMLDEIRQIKQQMEARLADRGERDIEVKLGHGGIRDIEFTVQVLQMLNGGRMPEFRVSNCLDAIRALDMRGLLSAFEATTLASNYVFLRQVEHRLQIDGGQQRHMLPKDPGDLDRFARRMGFPSGPAFAEEYRERAAATRAILDRFLATEGGGVQWTYDLLSPNAEGTNAIARLAKLGFKDPAKTRAELIQLSSGPEEDPYPYHVRRQFASLAPALLQALAKSADPDAMLVRLSRLLARLKAPGAVYGVLSDNPATCDYLVTLAANSEYLTELLIRDPGLFDIFGARDALAAPLPRRILEQELENLHAAVDADAAPYRLREGETLRVGVRDLFHGATVADVGRELTQLAEVCLDHVLQEAHTEVRRRYGDPPGTFAILGLGKLGGREISYGSDLDLIFVYDPSETRDAVEPSEYFAAVAANAIRRLKEVTRYGFLYDIDARLRPDGNKGVLAVSLSRLEQYYREEAQAWERLALMKARVVAGAAEAAPDLEDRVRNLAFSLPLTVDVLDNIEEIRVKIAQNASPWDLKKHEGGIAEIEFAVRLLQLRHHRAYPELERGDVLGALDVLTRYGLMDAQAFGPLCKAYLLFRKIENRIRMMHARAESTLPEDPDARQDLACRLGITDDIAQLVAEHKTQVHAVYKATLADLG